MKIGDHPPTIPPAASGPEAPGTGAAKPEGGEFASRLEGTSEMQGTGAGAPSGGGDVAAIAAEVDAGRISAAEAVRQVVDKVLDAQLPADAPAALRERVRALVEASLSSDPLLSSLVKRLGGGA